MYEPVIVSAVRTALGKFNGGLKDVPATKLGTVVIREALERANLNKTDINEVIMGMVLQGGMGQNPARQAALGADIPYSVGCYTVNKVCGSGLKAVTLAANSIKAGEYDTIVAGGMENMTSAPYILYRARSGYRLGDGKLIDLMVHDGLWDVYNDFHMGNTGERIAEHFNITREELDSFSLDSHKKALSAINEGRFKDEIIPVEIPQRRGDPLIVDTDEGPRADTSLEKLARLKPAFRKEGIITPGNASQISDGASALVVMNRERAEKSGTPVMARIVDYVTSGVKPEDVMEAPIPGIEEILKRNDMTMEDIDLVEHNEAFSSATVAIKRKFDIPEEKMNVNGGAVALGHPIGASGARILTTLLYALKHKGLNRGMATICLGGGNAVTMIVEME